jgi:hypothetical protein
MRFSLAITHTLEEFPGSQEVWADAGTVEKFREELRECSKAR